MAKVLKSIPVSVSEEVIADSVRRDSSHCMIADAIRKAVPNAAYVAVDLQTIRFTDKVQRRRYVFLTPRKAQELLVKFDQGIRPDPFTLRLANPQIVELSPDPRSHHPLKTAEKEETPAEPVMVPGFGPGYEVPAEPESVPAVKKPATKLSANQKEAPKREGGKTPPIAVLSNRGRVRKFGLKSLDV